MQPFGWPGVDKLFRTAALAVVLGSAPVALSAQADSATVVAGAQYDANSLEEALFGTSYRDLWTTPVRVEVLAKSGYGGGLTPVRRGQGRQTRSLRFRGADGREYTFRSTSKNQLHGPRSLKRLLIGGVVQDQVSSLHPAAAVVAAPLLEAAGVLHATPRLVVMPDDPGLGPYREEFAGMLGTIEEHPNEGRNDTPGFAGSRKIVGTERLLEVLRSDPEQRVDSRAYLRARLMDLLLGDWDRHEDQWRWARFERKGDSHWVPIPRDRDYAFVDYDGLVPAIARIGDPKIVRFDEEYVDLPGLLVDAHPLDHRFLLNTPKALWDSVAIDLQARLTDQVIGRAVRQMPAEYQARNAAQLAHLLRARRDRLPGAAERFYARLHQRARP